MAADGERYEGAVFYLYAFDVAFEMRPGPVATVLGVPVQGGEGARDPQADPPGDDRRQPRHRLQERPLVARLPAVEVATPSGPLRIEARLSILRMGAISIRLRVPFQELALGELVRFHDLALADGPIHAHACALASRVHRELMPLWVRPRPELPPEEAYTVFAIHTPIRDGTEWLQLHRREVAALVTQEQDPALLSEQETEETTSRFLSYYRQDVAVLDWDAALVIDQPRLIEETLTIIEVANLALAELEAYDQLLDGAVDRAYRDLNLGLPRRRILRQLGELRIDLARAGDALGNITKFFGDWHLARIYGVLAERFHLRDWQRTTEAKLRTVDGIYQLLTQARMNRWMLTLEIAVVVLFIADLIILLVHR